MFDFKNKDKSLTQFNNYTLAKTLKMFDYQGFPDSLPQIELEKLLQKKGKALITEYDGEMIVLDCVETGEPDLYGNYTDMRVDNVALKLHKDFKDGENCVVIKNDLLGLGLYDMMNRYNSMMVETEITMYLDLYNQRIQTLLSADDDNTKKSAETFIEKIENGELGIIGENPIFDGVKTHSTNHSNQNATQSLIEFNQYLRATLFNELGINANFNMKRERLNTSEIGMNEDVLKPFIDGMMESRKIGLEKVNEMFNTDYSVEFGSVWNKPEPIDEPETEPESETENDTVAENITLNILGDNISLNVEPDDEPENEPDDEPERGDDDDSE